MSTTQSLSDRAMLVRVNIRMFNPIKTDKTITAEVAQNHGSEVSMGRYAKSIIAKGCVDSLRKLAGEIRQEHYRRTLPWSDDGSRILTSAGYFPYAQFMRDCEAKWAPELNRFLGNWSEYVDDARIKLNGLFRLEDYPTPSELASKFEFRWGVRPLPVDTDFRVQLSADETASIRAELRSDLDATVKAAMQDVWQRMREVVAKMSERLKAYDPNNPGTAPFRDSLVTNITELLDVLPSLNLTNDPTLDAFAQEVRTGLTSHPANALRDNMYTRNDTINRADEILSKMSAFIA